MAPWRRPRAPEDIPPLQAEVRALAAERGAVILAHNYQLPEVQDVADYVGDSLGLSRQGAATDKDVIAFCGVHFMAETASILSPDKRVLIPDLDAGCSLADSITPEQLRAWQASTRRGDRDVRQHHGGDQGAHGLLRDLGQRRGRRRAHLRDPRPDTEILFGPTCSSAPTWRRPSAHDARVGRRVPRPRGHPPVGHRARARRAPRSGLPDPPRVRLLDLVMEYVAAGDVDSSGVHMLSTGGMLPTPRSTRARAPPAIMATETGMLHPLRMAAPDVEFIAANEAASCRYMKMITLPKLRDCLRDLTARSRSGPRSRRRHASRSSAWSPSASPGPAGGAR
jgi:quinolinate synthase